MALPTAISGCGDSQTTSAAAEREARLVETRGHPSASAAFGGAVEARRSDGCCSSSELFGPYQLIGPKP